MTKCPLCNGELERQDIIKKDSTRVVLKCVNCSFKLLYPEVKNG